MVRVQSFNQFKHPASRNAVQIAGGLVGHQKPRPANQCASQRDTLLLASRKLARPMIATILQSHLTKPVCGVRHRLSLAHAACQQRHGYIFLRSELRQQIMELPNVTDLAITKGSRLTHAK